MRTLFVFFHDLFLAADGEYVPGDKDGDGGVDGFVYSGCYLAEGSNPFNEITEDAAMTPEVRGSYQKYIPYHLFRIQYEYPFKVSFFFCFFSCVHCHTVSSPFLAVPMLLYERYVCIMSYLV